MTTIPFDGPTLLKAKRISGFVDIPESKNEESPMGNWGNGNVNFTPDEPAAGPKSDDQQERMAGPTYLKRTSTMAGNIVVVDVEGEKSQAFWLQRKVGQTAHGSIRLGFVLRCNETDDSGGNGPGRVWELAPGPTSDSDSGIDYQMVAIKMLDTTVLNSDHSVDSLLHNPVHELSALQMVASHYEKKGKQGHVVATKLVAVSSQHVYAILPYYPDGTLFQYCLSQESLKEPVARFFFRQILQGIETLQQVGLCHRNLSLETIAMDGDRLFISRLGWSLRVGKPSGGSEESKPVPPPGGSSPQYIAPEVFQNNSSEWDGFAVDLWACGLMLYSMVVSSQALFVAPIPEDRNFVELCIKGNVRKQAETFGKMTRQDLKLSDDLVDLLQKMLTVNPKERLSLAEIMDHPWVRDGVEEKPPKSRLGF